jgi:hypothetical protein
MRDSRVQLQEQMPLMILIFLITKYPSKVPA